VEAALKSSKMAYGGAQTAVNERIFVNVYDLHSANDCLHTIGFGLYHTGVQIRDQEFTFSPEGIFDHHPRTVPENVVFRETLEIGSFYGNAAAVRSAISELSEQFKPGSYHVLKKNCNSFSHALCLKLTGNPVPAYINRAANIGAMFPMFWPSSMQNAPVVSDSSSTAFASNFQAFSGGARKLNSSAPTTMEAPSPVDAQANADKLAMMRRQRLAKFEQQTLLSQQNAGESSDKDQ